MTALFVRSGKLEVWGDGDTPWHFDRLRWGREGRGQSRQNAKDANEAG
jgi:hypothetical protein